MKASTYHNQIFGFLLCGMICLPARSDGPSADVAAYKPSWAIGQTWHVDVETLTVPRREARRDQREFVPKKIVYGYTFEVEARNEIEGEPCYQVRAEAVSFNGKNLEFSPADYRYFYRFFFRADDCTLKTLQCFRVLGDEVAVQFSHRYSRGPVLATESTGFLPSDFPIFSQEAQKYVPSNKPAEPNTITGSTSIQSQQKHQPSKDMWIVNEVERPALNVTLVLNHPGDDAGAEVTEQVWVKGMPWPLRSEYRHGRRPPLSAKLVRVGDSPIVSTTRAQSP